MPHCRFAAKRRSALAASGCRWLAGCRRRPFERRPVASPDSRPWDAHCFEPGAARRGGPIGLTIRTATLLAEPALIAALCRNLGPGLIDRLTTRGAVRPFARPMK